MNKPILIATDGRKNGLEVWALYDPTAPVYELFASEECLDYVGAVDTLEECKPAAQAWFEQRASD
jgi:hypothetical protein